MDNNNIYQNAIQAVEGGTKFKVDFRSRSLKLNDKFIIQNGSYEGNLGVQGCCEEEFFTNVENLYRHYKHSVPSECSESKLCQYFMALPERSLSDDDMLFGERRDKSQIALELYILCQIINGVRWNAETMGKWFWQSKVDKDLVILKSWVEPDNN